MPKKKIALVGAGYMQSDILSRFAGFAGEGYYFFPRLGHGKQPSPFSEGDVEKAIEQCDAALIAISDFYDREVYAAELAIIKKKPFALLSLGWGTFESEAFAAVRPGVKTLFISEEAERVEAQKLFPNSQVVVIGHPELEEFFDPPQYTREQVREKLGVRPEQKLVLIAGEKTAAINLPLAVTAIEAVYRDDEPQSWKVVFAVHPGHEPVAGTTPLEFYRKELSAYAPDLDLTVSCKGDPFGMGTPAMVAGADVVVGTNSNVQVQAACMRIPAIGIPLRGAWRNRRMPMERSEWWGPYKSGAVAMLYDMSSTRLWQLMHELTDNPESAQRMHEAQKAQFPSMHSGESFEQMAKALNEL